MPRYFLNGLVTACSHWAYRCGAATGSGREGYPPCSKSACGIVVRSPVMAGTTVAPVGARLARGTCVNVDGSLKSIENTPCELPFRVHLRVNWVPHVCGGG